MTRQELVEEIWLKLTWPRGVDMLELIICSTLPFCTTTAMFGKRTVSGPSSDVIVSSRLSLACWMTLSAMLIETAVYTMHSIQYTLCNQRSPNTVWYYTIVTFKHFLKQGYFYKFLTLNYDIPDKNEQLFGYSCTSDIFW